MLSNLSKNRDRIKIQNIRWEEWKFLGKEVFRIKKRDKNFLRRAEARLETRVTRARFESYYRRIKRVLKTSQEGKKIEIAKRWCWLLDGNFFFLFFFYHLPGREAFAKCDYFTRKRKRERSTFPPLIFCSLWTVKGSRNAFLERYETCCSARSFIHSFISSFRSFRFNALCPHEPFFFSFSFICTPLESRSKGDIFLERLQLTGTGYLVADRWMKGIKKVSFA